MRKPLASLALLFAWLCANGALLDGVQVFAWARMFAGYAQVLPVADALRATFDPNRPCEMCLGIAAAKDTAKNQLPAAVEGSSEKITLGLPSVQRVVVAANPGDWPPLIAFSAPTRSDPVPVPPPRA